MTLCGWGWNQDRSPTAATALSYSQVPQTVSYPRRRHCLYNTGAEILGVVLGGNVVNVLPTPEPVVWMNAVGVLTSGNSLTKTAPEGWGNAGASSTRGIGLGNAKFTVSTTNGYPMYGLGSSDDNRDWKDIDFAIYPSPYGRLYIYEKGVYRGSFGTYSQGDTLRVGVEGAEK